MNSASNFWRSRGLVALGTVIVCCGCGEARTAVSSSPTEQRQRCSHIFGVDDDRPVAVFSIRNESSIKKTVTDIRKSCACFRAELSDKLISPKGASSLSLYMSQSTLRAPSAKAIQCDLEFDDGSRYACFADCTAYPLMSYSDADVNVGTIDFGGTVVHEIPLVIYSRGSTPPKVSVSSESDECRFDDSDLLRLSSSSVGDGVCMHRGSIMCAITPTIDRKGGGAVLTLRFVDQKHEQSEVLSLNWSTRSAYSFHPHMLILRGVKDAPQAVAEVVVDRAGGSGRFTIERIEHAHEDVLQVKTTSESAPARVTLAMSLKAPCKAAPFYGDVLVYISGSRTPLSVPYVVVP